MILITRSKDQSLILKQNLIDKGFQTIIYPLFDIVFYKKNTFSKIFFNSNKVKNILITSSNAINYLESLNLSKNIQILSIGNQTSKNLENLGYSNIKTAKDSAQSLLNLAKSQISKKDMTL